MGFIHQAMDSKGYRYTNQNKLKAHTYANTCTCVSIKPKLKY